MTSNLTNEITKRILANVGATPGHLFGKAGLTDPTLKLDNQIKIECDGVITLHDIYGGSIDLGDVSIRSILINLSIDNSTEFLLLFRYSSLAISAIKYIFDDDEEFPGFIRVFNESNDTWISSSMYMKATALAGFEKITSSGMLWERCEDIEDLYKASLTLISI